MADLHLQGLFDSFPLAERRQILRDAGLETQSLVGEIDVRIPGVGERIIPVVLRRRDVSNEEFALVVSETGLTLNKPAVSRVNVTLKFPGEFAGNGIPLTHLGVASVLLWELSARVASVLVDLKLEQPELWPPEVLSATRGSTSLGLGGTGLLVTGVGFIVASYSQLLPGAQPWLMSGGAFLTSVGVIDLIINWSKTIAETVKLGTDADLNRLNALKIQKELAAPLAAPPASLTDQVDIKANASSYGISEALGVHLLNRTLPALVELKTIAGNPEISSTPEPRQRAQSSGATR